MKPQQPAQRGDLVAICRERVSLHLRAGLSTRSAWALGVVRGVNRDGAVTSLRVWDGSDWSVHKLASPGRGCRVVPSAHLAVSPAELAQRLGAQEFEELDALRDAVRAQLSDLGRERVAQLEASQR